MDKKKILLIEDDQEMREFYADFLAQNGYLVDTAADGEEGWTKFSSGNYDLLLLDIMLPKLDGLGFLERRQKDAKLKLCPTVILTNLGQDEVLKKCFALGVKYYILKAETTPNQVLPVLAKALEGS